MIVIYLDITIFFPHQPWDIFKLGEAQSKLIVNVRISSRAFFSILFTPSEYMIPAKHFFFFLKPNTNDWFFKGG